MAVILEANYSKKMGLPAYSSHSFSVTIRTEIADVSDVQHSAAQLYRLLQDAVDRSIQEVGYTPVPLGAGSESNRPTGRPMHWPSRCPKICRGCISSRCSFSNTSSNDDRRRKHRPAGGDSCRLGLPWYGVTDQRASPGHCQRF